MLYEEAKHENSKKKFVSIWVLLVSKFHYKVIIMKVNNMTVHYILHEQKKKIQKKFHKCYLLAVTEYECKKAPASNMIKSHNKLLLKNCICLNICINNSHEKRSAAMS